MPQAEHTTDRLGKALQVSHNEPAPDSALLSLCALLRWFDRDLLRELSGCDEGEIEALLRSDYVVPAPEPPGAYCLRDDLRAEALARLRADRPSDELTLHSNVLDHFLRCMAKVKAGDRRLADEEACFYHLNKIFLLIAARREWPRIAEYVATVRAAGPQKAYHLHRLDFYESYVSIRTQDYSHSETILVALLDQPNLENDLQVEILNALGQIYWFQTHYDRALTFYRRVHTLAYETGALFYQGVALINMSMIYNELSYYDQALDLSMQSLQIFRALHDSPREANALYEIGNNAMRLGRWQIAQAHFHEAIKLCKALDLEARWAYLYWVQGFLYLVFGEEVESEKSYLHALTISQSTEHGELSVTMDAWIYLGFLYQTQGRWDEALDAYEQAVISATQLRNQHWLSVIYYRRGNIFERQAHPDDALAAYQQAIDGIESLRSETETEEIKIGLLGTTQQVYESIVLLCIAQGRPDAAFDYVERARSRAFLDVLAKKSPELYDTFAQPVATLADVQAGLPPGALLLEYYTTGVLPRGESLINQIPPENARLREHLAQPPHIYIFAVTRDHFEVHHAPLDPNILRPPEGDPSPIRRLLRGRLPAQLYDALLAPVAQLLHECGLLYLIPHGPLHYVPFAALAAMHGGMGPAIALAPSATVLLRSCLGRPPAGATHASPLLALGYNDPAGDTPLRYAEAEAGHIARMLGGEALVGPAPKRERLFDAGRQARWLHVAGHAIYHPRDSLESELRTGDGESLSARAIIAGLDLDADLVTLSACTSGVSQVVAGDELLGLQRAFLYAGARAVLCTLWEAADFVALLLMDRFYADLRRGQTPAVALHDAQAALRAMTGRDVAATIERWRADDPAFVAALGELPAIPPEELDTLLYADPLWWAPFTLIGKAD